MEQPVQKSFFSKLYDIIIDPVKDNYDSLFANAKNIAAPSFMEFALFILIILIFILVCILYHNNTIQIIVNRVSRCVRQNKSINNNNYTVTAINKQTPLYNINYNTISKTTTVNCLYDNGTNYHSNVPLYDMKTGLTNKKSINCKYDNIYNPATDTIYYDGPPELINFMNTDGLDNKFFLIDQSTQRCSATAIDSALSGSRYTAPSQSPPPPTSVTRAPNSYYSPILSIENFTSTRYKLNSDDNFSEHFTASDSTSSATSFQKSETITATSGYKFTLNVDSDRNDISKYNDNLYIPDLMNLYNIIQINTTNGQKINNTAWGIKTNPADYTHIKLQNLILQIEPAITDKIAGYLIDPSTANFINFVSSPVHPSLPDVSSIDIGVFPFATTKQQIDYAEKIVRYAFDNNLINESLYIMESTMIADARRFLDSGDYCKARLLANRIVLDFETIITNKDYTVGVISPTITNFTIIPFTIKDKSNFLFQWTTSGHFQRIELLKSSPVDLPLTMPILTSNMTSNIIENVSPAREYIFSLTVKNLINNTENSLSRTVTSLPILYFNETPYLNSNGELLLNWTLNPTIPLLKSRYPSSTFEIIWDPPQSSATPNISPYPISTTPPAFPYKLPGFNINVVYNVTIRVTLNATTSATATSATAPIQITSRAGIPILTLNANIISDTTATIIVLRCNYLSDEFTVRFINLKPKSSGVILSTGIINPNDIETETISTLTIAQLKTNTSQLRNLKPLTKYNIIIEVYNSNNEKIILDQSCTGQFLNFTTLATPH
jgi:hypothetical protein